MESSEQTSFTSSHRPLHQQDQQEGQLSRDQFPVTMSRRHRRRPNGIEATRRHQHRVDPYIYVNQVATAFLRNNGGLHHHHQSFSYPPSARYYAFNAFVSQRQEHHQQEPNRVSQYYSNNHTNNNDSHTNPTISSLPSSLHQFYHPLHHELLPASN
jgi:hypothetical protein